MTIGRIARHGVLRHRGLRTFGLISLALLPVLASAVELPARAQEIAYTSPAVDRELKYAVLLPDGYARSDQRWPLLILLHGHTGHYRSWITYAGLSPDVADELGAVVVLADGGNAFYTNWHGAQGRASQRWEDAIVEDLLGDVQRRWRVRPDRNGRAIGGLSMGGYGAIAIALRHPKLFGTAFSSAGALRFAQRARDEIARGQDDWNRPELWSQEEKPPVPIKGFATQRERTPHGRVFTTAAQADQADPFVLAARIDTAAAPYLHLDCGTQDSLSEESRAFAQLLRKHNIAHSFVELPGDHEVPYWTDAFAHTALILRKQFARPVVATSTAPRARP